MTNRLFSLATVALSLLAGCATAPSWLGGTDSVSLSVRTAVQSGSQAYRVQGLNYTKASINHLVLRVYTLDGQDVPHELSTPLSADIQAAALDEPVVFKSLHPATRYRITAAAYKNAGTDGADLISTEDSNSFVNLTVNATQNLGTITVPVKLINVTFGATASAGISVTDGTVDNPDEVITAPTPDPTTVMPDVGFGDV